MMGGVRLLVSTEVGDITAEVRRLFEDLARARPAHACRVPGECVPLLDVFETEGGLELVLDLPGVEPDSVRVLIKNGVVVIAGEKTRPPLAGVAPSFHLVERDFGRFVRAVRVHVAIDAARARARLVNGELRIALPKLAERRGREFIVPIEPGP